MPRRKKKYIELEKRRAKALARLRPPYLRHLRSVQRFKPIRAIYFLCQLGDVVYVGQSRDLARRLGGHEDKLYDRVYFIPYSGDTNLNESENFFISLFRPKYNRVGGSYGDSLFISSKMLALHLRVSVRQIKNLAQLPLREGASEWFNREDILNFLSNGAYHAPAVLKAVA